MKNSVDNQNRANGFLENIKKDNSVLYLRYPEEGQGIVSASSNSLCHCDIHGKFSDCECNDAQDVDVIPVWAKKYQAYAKNYASDLELIEIDTDEFLNKMLPWLIESNLLLGINWDHQGYGIEVRPNEL